MISHKEKVVLPPLLGTLWTAVHIDDATKQRIVDKISSMLDREVLLETALRPELIAGFRVELADRVFDCSLQTQMLSMQQDLDDMDIDFHMLEL